MAVRGFEITGATPVLRQEIESPVPVIVAQSLAGLMATRNAVRRVSAFDGVAMKL